MALNNPMIALTMAITTHSLSSKRRPKTKTTATNSHVWGFCIKYLMKLNRFSISGIIYVSWHEGTYSFCEGYD